MNCTLIFSTWTTSRQSISLRDALNLLRGSCLCIISPSTLFNQRWTLLVRCNPIEFKHNGKSVHHFWILFETAIQRAMFLSILLRDRESFKHLTIEQ